MRRPPFEEIRIVFERYDPARDARPRHRSHGPDRPRGRRPAAPRGRADPRAREEPRDGRAPAGRGGRSAGTSRAPRRWSHASTASTPCSSCGRRRRPRSAPLSSASRRAQRRVVFLSSPWKTQHPFFQQPNPGRLLHAEIERLIEGSGCAWTFLRPGMFAANALGWWAPRIRAGDDIGALALRRGPDGSDPRARRRRCRGARSHRGGTRRRRVRPDGAPLPQPVRAGVDPRRRDRPPAAPRGDLAVSRADGARRALPSARHDDALRRLGRGARPARVRDADGRRADADRRRGRSPNGRPITRPRSGPEAASPAPSELSGRENPRCRGLLLHVGRPVDDDAQGKVVGQHFRDHGEETLAVRGDVESDPVQPPLQLEKRLRRTQLE